MGAEKQGAPLDRPAVGGAGHLGQTLRRSERLSVLHREVRDQQPAGALVGLGPRLAPAQELGLRGGTPPPQRGEAVAGKIHFALGVHSGASGVSPGEPGGGRRTAPS